MSDEKINIDKDLLSDLEEDEEDKPMKDQENDDDNIYNSKLHQEILLS